MDKARFVVTLDAMAHLVAASSYYAICFLADDALAAVETFAAFVNACDLRKEDVAVDALDSVGHSQEECLLRHVFRDLHS